MLALQYGFAALGKQIGNIVSDYLSRKYSITPNETYNNPKLLHEALEKSLGYGSALVETRIVKSLYSSLPTQSDQPRIRVGHPDDFEKSLYHFLNLLETSKKNT